MSNHPSLQIPSVCSVGILVGAPACVEISMCMIRRSSWWDMKLYHPPRQHCYSSSMYRRPIETFVAFETPNPCTVEIHRSKRQSRASGYMYIQNVTERFGNGLLCSLIVVARPRNVHQSKMSADLQANSICSGFGHHPYWIEGWPSTVSCRCIS